MAGATVVKEVQAQMTAKSDLLLAELERIVAKSKQAKQEVEGSGAAAATAGNKYAGGARQIAMATETIARMGKVTGESGKQIVAQAANIAFAFGTAGAAFGAVGIFGLAIHQMFTRAKREAAEAREEFEKTIRVIGANRDYRAAGQLITSVIAGDPTSQDESRQLGLFRMRERLAAAEAAVRRRALPGGGFVSEATRAQTLEIQRLRDEVGKLEADYRAAQAAFTEISALEQQRLANLKRLAEDEKASDEARAEAKRQLKEALDAEREAAEQLQKSILSFQQQFADLLLNTFGTAGEKAAAPIDALIAKAHELNRAPAEIELLETLRAQAVTAAEAVERIETALYDVETAGRTGAKPTVQEFVRLAEEAARAKRALDSLTAGTPEWKRLRDAIDDVTEAQADLLQGIADANNDGGGKTPADRTAEMARSIQQAVDGALQLAMAFGGVNDELGTTLRALTQIAGNIPALGTAIGSGSALRIIGAGLPILGALGSLFGDSEAERRHRATIEENTRAIEELTARAGQLGIGVTGAAAGTAAAQLERLMSSPDFWRAGAGVPGRGTISDVARRLGVDLDALDKIAAAHGITLDGSTKSFLQLQEALGLTITKLGEFDDTLDSRVAQAEAEIVIFGITDPAEQARIRRGARAGLSPILDSVTAGLDLSTAEGREQARRNAQDVFRIMESGGRRLTDVELGDLTGDQLLDALLELVRGLDAIDAAQGTNVSTVSRGDRVIGADRTQITADQASRLLGVNVSQLAELRMIREALTGVIGPMPVPALNAGFSGGGGAPAMTLTVSQHFEFHGPVGDPRAVGMEIGQATVEQIDRALGGRLRIQRLHTGKMVTR